MGAIGSSSDEYGTDQAYKIEKIFNRLKDNAPEVGWAFNQFKGYKEENNHLFIKDIIRLIWETADAIAASFSGKNKAEVIMLSKLEVLVHP